MRTIAHLSDLHFGRIDTTLLPALTDALALAKPDLLVVSGDLTQRARTSEFRAARQFLDTLPYPRLIVPGNHDMPLYNPLARWLRPFQRFHAHTNAGVQPAFMDAEIAVIGINTARAGTIKNGRINRQQMDAIAAFMAPAGPAVTRIVVTHHPFDLPAEARGESVIGRAQMAMAGFSQSRVDLVLSGHLHGSGTSDGVARYGLAGRQVLLVQAGTATSTRQRGEVNSFNLIEVQHPLASIRCMAWNEAANCFRPTRMERFHRNGAAWTRNGAEIMVEPA